MISGATRYRKRHPLRVAIQRKLTRARATYKRLGLELRIAELKIARLERELANNRLNICGECGLGYRLACPRGLHGSTKLRRTK